jgi:hypothetical protein
LGSPALADGNEGEGEKKDERETGKTVKEMRATSGPGCVRLPLLPQGRDKIFF